MIRNKNEKYMKYDSDNNNDDDDDNNKNDVGFALLDTTADRRNAKQRKRWKKNACRKR